MTPNLKVVVRAFSEAVTYAERVDDLKEVAITEVIRRVDLLAGEPETVLDEAIAERDSARDTIESLGEMLKNKIEVATDLIDEHEIGGEVKMDGGGSAMNEIKSSFSHISNTIDDITHEIRNSNDYDIERVTEYRSDVVRELALLRDVIQQVNKFEYDNLEQDRAYGM